MSLIKGDTTATNVAFLVDNAIKYKWEELDERMVYLSLSEILKVNYINQRASWSVASLKTLIISLLMAKVNEAEHIAKLYLLGR